jgi:hypothetical protein
MPGIRFPWLPTLALLATFGGAAHAADTPVPGLLADWPAIHSERPADPALEQRVRTIVAGMTLAQKMGQMTQAEISRRGGEAAQLDDPRVQPHGLQAVHGIVVIR